MISLCDCMKTLLGTMCDNCEIFMSHTSWMHTCKDIQLSPGYIHDLAQDWESLPSTGSSHIQSLESPGGLIKLEAMRFPSEGFWFSRSKVGLRICILMSSQVKLLLPYICSGNYHHRPDTALLVTSKTLLRLITLVEFHLLSPVSLTISNQRQTLICFSAL